MSKFKIKIQSSIKEISIPAIDRSELEKELDADLFKKKFQGIKGYRDLKDKYEFSIDGDACVKLLEFIKAKKDRDYLYRKELIFVITGIKDQEPLVMPTLLSSHRRNVQVHDIAKFQTRLRNQFPDRDFIKHEVKPTDFDDEDSFDDKMKQLAAEGRKVSFEEIGDML